MVINCLHSNILIKYSLGLDFYDNIKSKTFVILCMDDSVKCAHVSAIIVAYIERPENNIVIVLLKND